MDKKEILGYIDTLSNIVISLSLFLLPVIFFTNATDAFIIPKQLLIIGAASLLLVIWAVRIVVERKIVAVASPLNLPIVLFGIVLAISAVLSPNRYDSLMQVIPVVAAILFALIIANTVRAKSAFTTALSAYVLGAAVSAIITLAYTLKLYFLPFAGLDSQFFNTTGSGIQQIVYLLPVLIFCAVYVGKKVDFPRVKLTSATSDYGFYIQLISLIFITLGLLAIIYQIIFTPNKPVLLPYIYGFQTAFAAISQDASRFFLALLFGSGYGTFLVDFTRYKLPSFNLEQNIWNLSFSFSSSFFLEIIATTGLLGALTFLGLVFSVIKTGVRRNPMFAAIFVYFILSIILPFSYITVAGLFILIGLYISELNIAGDRRVYEVMLSLVTRKSGMFAFEATPEGERAPRNDSAILPVIVAVVVLLIVGFNGFYTYKFAVSDTEFAQSLQAAQANNGQKTYQLQTAAINDFPYRSDYQRIFSQVNLALANSIAGGIQAGSSPSAQTQQNILALLQQSINSGRNAVVLSPRTSLNWQNLGVVYRSLINVGQNADQFAVASMNQAIALDPYNPNLYVALGGIYYQLGQWDQAASQFQVAINLKQDFSNAYYNLGHAYESKGDLQNALTAYEAVKQLSVGNADNLAKINAEIQALQDKIGSAAKNNSATNVQPQTDQTPLSVSGPAAVLPTQKPPVKISPPPAASGTPTPTPSVSPEPSGTVTPSVSPTQ